MSTNTVDKLETINSIDPRMLCLNQGDLKWAIPQGPSNTNVVAINSSAYGTSGVNFTFNTQGMSTMISRLMYVECQFKVTVTGIAPLNGYLIHPGQSAPRAFPLMSISNALGVTINGTSLNTTYADTSPILRFCNDHWLSEFDLSGTPTMLDNYTEYATGTGAIRNPLNSYNSSGYSQGRGAFRLDSLTQTTGDGTATRTATILFTVREPLIMSPMAYSCSSPQSALIGVQNMSVNLVFSGDLSRVWSGVINGANPTVTMSMGPNVTALPQLRVTYLNVPLISASKIPSLSMYNYFELKVHENNQNVSLASLASGTYDSASIQTSTIPKSILIYAGEPRSGKTYASTDTYFSINSLSLQFINQSGQFSSFSQHDLYSISVKNGYKGSFQEWSGFTTNYTSDTGTNIGLSGSIIKLDSTDLSIPSNLAPGVPTNSQLQATVNITNQSTQSRAVSVFVVIINEGVFTISNGSSIVQTNILSQDDVIKARTEHKMETRDYCNSSEGVYGGSFWDKAKSFSKQLSPLVPLAKTLLCGKGDVGGAVVGGAVVGGAVVGGKPMAMARNRNGGAIVGGQSLSRDELRRMME